MRDDVKHGIFVVAASRERRHVRHVVRDPRDGSEPVLRDLVDALEVDEVFEETRVAGSRQRQRRAAIVVPDGEQVLECVHLK